MCIAVIGEVQCGFLFIYLPILYNVVFLLHVTALTLIKIGFGVV